MSSSNLKSRRKVLLVGWDAADWKVIRPLLIQGKMPHLKRLVEKGAWGNIATLQPCLSPILWTSIATGKRPYKHGILGLAEPDPHGGGVRPVTNLSRKTKAIWNILNQEGRSTITVGWWPSYPAEPLSRGVMVSNLYKLISGPMENWPMPEGVVHPVRLSEPLKELRCHPQELEAEDLCPFLSGLNELDSKELEALSQNPLIYDLRTILSENITIHAAATALLQNEPWELFSVYYDGLDHLSHGFMRFHPPRRPQVDEKNFKIFHQVVEAGYRFHDAMLGTLISLAGEDCTVIVVSDHGFHPDHLRLRPGQIPREPAGPATEHRSFGMVVVEGRGIRSGIQIRGASVLDICPTLLHLFGLPAGEDMDGKVLTELFEVEFSQPLPRIPSWDEVSGESGMHPEEKQISPRESQAALEQLAALGYLEKPAEGMGLSVENTLRELDYHLAQSYLDGGFFSEAVEILERLYERWPMEHRFGFKLAACYHSQRRSAELRRLAAVLRERRMEEARQAREELQSLESQEARQELGLGRTGGGEADRAAIFRRRTLLAKLRPNLSSLSYLDALADFCEGRYRNALEHLTAVERDSGIYLQAEILRGQCLQRLRQWPEAQKVFQSALEVDPEFHPAWLGLARVALGRRDYREAIRFAQSSLDLLPFQPLAYYLMGVAHFRLGEWPVAEEAFFACLRQAPFFTAALRALREIARNYRRDASLAFQYQLLLQKARHKWAELKMRKRLELEGFSVARPASSQGLEGSQKVRLKVRPEALAGVPEERILTVVTGLPRSGTSLMMQILQAAGIPAFCDDCRPADELNPWGYFEHSLVAQLRTAHDLIWLLDVRGKAVKVVVPLVGVLPLQILDEDGRAIPLHFRMVMMERDLEEILDSQERMLRNKGKPLQSRNLLSRAFAAQLHQAKAWIAGNGISTLCVPFRDLVTQPDLWMPKVAEFLQRPDKVPEMRQVVHARP